MLSIVSKPYWPIKPRALVTGVAAVAGLLYPFIVYFGIGTVPPLAIVAAALALLALRLLTLPAGTAAAWRVPLAVAVLCLGGAAAWNQFFAVKAYPIAVSLGFAAVFSHSLRHPPTVVERFARLTHPNLPPDGIAYCRTVTKVWIAFLLGNALLTAGLSLWGSLAAWTLWTGFLAYLAMGLLFAGEMIVRRRVQRRGAP